MIYLIIFIFVGLFIFSLSRKKIRTYVYFEDLKLSKKKIAELNQINFDDICNNFEKLSNQKISYKIREEFKFTGLNNEDFLFSNFLNQYNLKNLNEL